MRGNDHAGEDMHTCMIRWKQRKSGGRKGIGEAVKTTVRMEGVNGVTSSS